ncbi:PREDICTED: E3 ubiquitin-protein ligase RNF103 [Aptenodytes forsteri]|uniref:E3 ubiquitin-protein ligase RNF103 n=1 Tax=Aptenodytes forsteri TaxID=9233 RepID=UPI0004F4A6EC|nr:PREDICTED: E3 ubiquitin-protein ligase RNF103 [Aptenodytes forsteri]
MDFTLLFALAAAKGWEPGWRAEARSGGITPTPNSLQQPEPNYTVPIKPVLQLSKQIDSIPAAQIFFLSRKMSSRVRIAPATRVRAWYESGFLATQLVDPVALSFRKLRTILECRGLGHSGLPEKKDVRELVEKSGDLMEGELYSALKEEEASESVSSTNFSGEMHFYELVEDTKDGIWLVQVVANDRSPLVGKVHWEKMVKKVSRFGIRTGTFNCSSDPRYCRRRGWLKSTLIMSVPQTSTSKGKVMLKEYSGCKIEVEHIFKWITAHAASRIKTIYNSEHLKEEWNKSDQYRVKIYLFANLDQPPAFFSALSVKFTGRVEFIFVNVENWDNKSYMAEIGIYKTPSYILRTPEGIYRYGNNTGEFISLRAMDSFLRSLQPEVNDLFVLSLVLVNLMAWMDLFITQGATIKRFVVLISTLGTYNSLLIISWLPVLGFLQLPYLDSFYEYSLKLFRYSNTTTLASWVRADWMFYSSHPALFLSTYLGHGLLIDYFEKKRRRNNNTDEVNANNLEWLSSLWDWYTSYLFHPIASFQHFPFDSDWDEDPDLFLERLAFPDLWLHPLIPTDYIKNLPMWRFKCLGVHSDEEMLETFQDSESDSDSENKEVFSSEKEVSEDDELNTFHRRREGEPRCGAETCSCANKYCHREPYERKARSYGSYSTAGDMEPDWSAWPSEMLHCTECVVCLENFANGCLLVGLPCGHVFHQNCIVMWLAGGRHCCPVCRWASYKKKHPYTHPQPLSNDTPS